MHLKLMQASLIYSFALVMAAIGIAASWIPAIRASRVDPAITMRAQ